MYVTVEFVSIADAVVFALCASPRAIATARCAAASASVLARALVLVGPPSKGTMAAVTSEAIAIRMRKGEGVRTTVRNAARPRASRPPIPSPSRGSLTHLAGQGQPDLCTTIRYGGRMAVLRSSKLFTHGTLVRRSRRVR